MSCDRVAGLRFSTLPSSLQDDLFYLYYSYLLVTFQKIYSTSLEGTLTLYYPISHIVAGPNFRMLCNLPHCWDGVFNLKLPLSKHKSVVQLTIYVEHMINTIDTSSPLFLVIVPIVIVTIFICILQSGHNFFHTLRFKGICICLDL